jgi:TctA family transporter
MDGVSLVAMAMGLFGVAEILTNMGNRAPLQLNAKSISFRSLIPSREEVRQCFMPTVRGSLVGSVIGALPGTGPAIAAFMSYALEKRIAADPSRFGQGAIEGIAAPEAANNAAVQTAFIPTLSLGVPGDVVMAVMLGALMIHGITPGPQFLAKQPEMFWGLVASFWIGNVLLLILNIPLIGIWVRIVAIPYNILYPAILFFICVGAYSARNNVFDVYVVLLFGVVGYFLALLRYPAAPLLLGFILGPLMEEHLRRTLLISDGSFMPFIQRPLSALFLALTAVMLGFSLYSTARR